MVLMANAALDYGLKTGNKQFVGMSLGIYQSLVAPPKEGQIATWPHTGRLPQRIAALQKFMKSGQGAEGFALTGQDKDMFSCAGCHSPE